jgi:hypothetical protein
LREPLRPRNADQEAPAHTQANSKSRRWRTCCLRHLLGFKFASTIAFNTLNTTQETVILGAFRSHGQSKLANILYPAELAWWHPSITFVSSHPGVIKTGLVNGLSGFNRYFTEATTFASQVTIEEGAKNQLWVASVDKSEIVSGSTMSRCASREGTLR